MKLLRDVIAQIREDHDDDNYMLTRFYDSYCEECEWGYSLYSLQTNQIRHYEYCSSYDSEGIEE